MKSPCDKTEEESWFRVRVCLSRFFSDERARVLVRVSGARRVRWLRRRLRRLLALPAPLALLAHGHLLPPDECLAVLQPDDVVEVIPASVDLDNPATDDEPTIEPKETTLPDQPIYQSRKKRKRHSSIQKQCVTEECSTAELPSDTVSDNTSDLASSAGNQNTATEEKVTSAVDPLQEIKERALALLDTCAPAPRRRRVRRRRPRRPLAPLDFQIPLAQDITETSTTEVDLQSEVDSQANESEIISINERTCINQNDVVMGNEHETPSAVSLQSPPVAAPAAPPPAAPAWLCAAPTSPNVVRNDVTLPRVARLVRPIEAS